jgi:hypothetical protein
LAWSVNAKTDAPPYTLTPDAAAEERKTGPPDAAVSDALPYTLAMPAVADVADSTRGPASDVAMRDVPPLMLAMPWPVRDSAPDVVTAAEPPAVVELSCNGPVVVATTDEPP